jgi:hypothetical protein
LVLDRFWLGFFDLVGFDFSVLGAFDFFSPAPLLAFQFFTCVAFGFSGLVGFCFSSELAGCA